MFYAPATFFRPFRRYHIPKVLSIAKPYKHNVDCISAVKVEGEETMRLCFKRIVNEVFSDDSVDNLSELTYLYM